MENGTENFSLLQVINRVARTDPDKTAYVSLRREGNTEVTYRQLWYDIKQKAEELQKQGIKKGDYVVIGSSTPYAHFLLMLAAAYLGAIPVSTNSGKIANNAAQERVKAAQVLADAQAEENGTNAFYIYGDLQNGGVFEDRVKALCKTMTMTGKDLNDEEKQSFQETIDAVLGNTVLKNLLDPVNRQFLSEQNYEADFQELKDTMVGLIDQKYFDSPNKMEAFLEDLRTEMGENYPVKAQKMQDEHSQKIAELTKEFLGTVLYLCDSQGSSYESAAYDCPENYKVELEEILRDCKFIQFSSGTTGKKGESKAGEVTSEMVVKSVDNLMDGPNYDVVINVNNLGHDAALVGGFGAWIMGATLANADTLHFLQSLQCFFPWVDQMGKLGKDQTGQPARISCIFTPDIMKILLDRVIKNKFEISQQHLDDLKSIAVGLGASHIPVNLVKTCDKIFTGIFGEKKEIWCGVGAFEVALCAASQRNLAATINRGGVKQQLVCLGSNRNRNRNSNLIVVDPVTLKQVPNGTVGRAAYIVDGNPQMISRYLSEEHTNKHFDFIELGEEQPSGFFTASGDNGEKKRALITGDVMVMVDGPYGQPELLFIGRTGEDVKINGQRHSAPDAENILKESCALIFENQELSRRGKQAVETLKFVVLNSADGGLIVTYWVLGIDNLKAEETKIIEDAVKACFSIDSTKKAMFPGVSFDNLNNFLLPYPKDRLPYTSSGKLRRGDVGTDLVVAYNLETTVVDEEIGQTVEVEGFYHFDGTEVVAHLEGCLNGQWQRQWS